MRIIFEDEMSNHSDLEIEVVELMIEDSVMMSGGRQIAEIFVETMDDRMSHMLGHPAAGKWCVPGCERDARGYERMRIMEAGRAHE